jgi:hypothetical protein
LASAEGADAGAFGSACAARPGDSAAGTALPPHAIKHSDIATDVTLRSMGAVYNTQPT